MLDIPGGPAGATLSHVTAAGPAARHPCGGASRTAGRSRGKAVPLAAVR